MPTTPQVNFNFVNENVQVSTPMLGVSHVLARTTRGKFNSPDTVISSWPQFQRIYGEEIVPDGTVSNIKKALELGSKLRISRVSGNPDEVAYGYAHTISSDGTPSSENTLLVITLMDPVENTQKYRIVLSIRTAEQGSPVLDTVGDNLDRNFYIKLKESSGPTSKIYLIQSRSKDFSANDILDSRLLFSSSKPNVATTFVDPDTLNSFIKSVPNISLELVDITTITGESLPNYTTAGIDGVVSMLKTYSNWGATVSIAGSNMIDSTGIDLVINEGNNGGESTLASWKNAYDAVKGYNDAYQLICSHIHQHLSSTDAISALKYVSEEVNKYFDQVHYVEVPKYNADNEVMTPEEIVDWLETNVPVIGYHKTTAYFGGGIKYYNENGSLQNCDVLGTVLGLGDSSATTSGPWYSFAGMNRGVVTSAQGPVMANLGGSGHVETLQSLADWYLNLFVVKDTRTQGKRTMLWHSFTSNPTNNSEKFLSIVRLNLYLKKNLLPILESYLEEPNIWDTWVKIYYEAKDILDDLVTRNAISEYTWSGDQFATSYSDLTVNNEADVRQGKYRIKLRYKDIVPMQEVYMDLIIDSASKDISVSTTE